MTTGKITIGKVSLTPQPNPIKKDGQISMNYHQILLDVVKKMMMVAVVFNLLVIS